jgi:hypothetical protein
MVYGERGDAPFMLVVFSSDGVLMTYRYRNLGLLFVHVVKSLQGPPPPPRKVSSRNHNADCQIAR